MKVEESQAAINTDDNTVNPTNISTGVVYSAVAQKNFPLNKGTLEAINGIEQTEMLFERFLTLQKLRIGCGSAEWIPPATEEYQVANKYFIYFRSKKKPNIRRMQGQQCRISVRDSLGYHRFQNAMVSCILSGHDHNRFHGCHEYRF